MHTACADHQWKVNVRAAVVDLDLIVAAVAMALHVVVTASTGLVLGQDEADMAHLAVAATVPRQAAEVTAHRQEVTVAP